MIRGVHAMFYTTEAEKARAFLRDKLGLPHYDAGEGWLIFPMPKSEVGCHPSEKPFHEVSFFCDDIEGTIADLKKKGVKFEGSIQDAGFGHVIHMLVPGGVKVLLYEPKYEMPG